jgi:hypothetical protein
MKILNKLKNLFRERKESETPKLEEIDKKHLKEHLEKIKIKNKEILNKNTDSFYNTLAPLLEELEEHILLLKEVDISKRKVDERTRNITQIGRKQYIEALETLIENLRERKEQPTLHILKEMERFSKQELRAEFKASQIIGKEIENIKKTLTTIKRAMNNFLENTEKLLEKNKEISNIDSILIELNEKEKNKNKVIQEIENLEKENKSLLKESNENGTKIETLKKSPKFLESKKKSESLRELEKILSEIKNQLKNYLNEKTFAKYIHIEKDFLKKKFITKYSLNPLESVLKDKGLEIIPFLKTILEKVEKKELSLKENELSGLKEAIKDLKTKKEDYILTIERINQLKEKIESEDIEKNIIELEKENRKREQQREFNESAINRLKTKEKQSSEEIEILEKEIKDILYEKLNILIQDS